jgi:hypothetical protein
VLPELCGWLNLFEEVLIARLIATSSSLNCSGGSLKNY